MKFYRRQDSGLLDHMVARKDTDIAVHTGSTALVYLIHGVTGTPAEMRYLAHALARQGCDVYATTLPGHCRRVRDLALATDQDWRDHVHMQIAFARKQYEAVFVAGLSAGGHLAMDAAVHFPLQGLGLLSPTFFYDGWNTPWSHAILPLAMKYIPLKLQTLLFHLDGPPFGIKDPVLQEQIRKAYHPGMILKEWFHGWRPGKIFRTKHDGDAAASGNPIFPLISLTQIDRLIQRAKQQVAQVTLPTIVLQARDDDMTSPRNAQFVMDRIASKKKKMVLLNDSYHVITVDKQKKDVAMHLRDFFEIPSLHPSFRSPQSPQD